LLTDLAYRRNERVKAQFDYVIGQADELGFASHPAFKEISTQAETQLTNAERRQQQLQELDEQGATKEQLARIYPRFLRSVDISQLRVNDAQQAFLYLTVNKQQRDGFGERLAYTERVCDELSQLLKYDVGFLPVIWDGYASFDIIYQDFYAIHLPRDDDIRRGAPVIAHEFGHSLYDNLDPESRRAFRERLETVCSEFVDRKQPVVRLAWRNWFGELICDACGALTFGPAYLAILTERLCTSDPYDIPSEAAAIGHPPDALRYRLVEAILEEQLPGELYEAVHDYCHQFETHLTLVNGRQPPSYQGWVDDELLTRIIDAAEQEIDSDVAELSDHLLNGADPETCPAQQERLAVNQEIFEF
jgi:hypothetical protein